MLVPNFELGEHIESKASLLSKVYSICINHLNCLACASDLPISCLCLSHYLGPISNFLHTFLFLVSRAKEHAPKFIFLSVVVTWRVYFQYLGTNLEIHQLISYFKTNGIMH